jgi:GNAT superfamily N-acetyltransferase
VPRREADIVAVHVHLVREGAVAPVVPGGDEERRWLDCDLASLAENRIGDPTDPRDLDAARRAAWQSRVTEEAPWSIEARSRYERCYWLLEGRERIGTIALASTLTGPSLVGISSFYLLPTHRGRGAGKRALAAVQAAAAREDLGVRLDTSWCWQRAVRFYVSAGLWVYMWKRELTLFSSPDLPLPLIDVGDTDASIAVARRDGTRVELATARRRGDVLESFDDRWPTAEQEPEEQVREAYYPAASTLSLALALRGWPLVRSPEEWEESHHADGGPPEALAYKITLWEAWARSKGWLVKTPRIPGLEYPTWQDFEARWEADRREFDAKLVT